MKKQALDQARFEPLYFLGIVPPEPIQQEVTALKEEAQAKFQTGHALNSPPHLTLVPPFKSTRTNFSVLAEFTRQQPPFELRLLNFGKFDQKVIFVDVATNPALLNLQKELLLYVHYHLGIEPDYQPFHPHMTIAFKDLKRPDFPQAWAHFSAKPFDHTFTVDALSLFSFGQKKWTVHESWPLGA